MSKDIFKYAGLFLVLTMSQLLIFNQIHLGGFITGYVYILFLLLFPLYSQQTIFILIAFLTGLCLDFFENSGGVHAAACLLLAYFRPMVLKFSFGVSYEYNTLKISQTPWGERLTYISILVFIHHFTFYSLDFFNFKHFLLILKSTVFSGVFSIFLIVVLMIIFGRNSK
jgi:hypothetical protein